MVKSDVKFGEKIILESTSYKFWKNMFLHITKKTEIVFSVGALPLSNSLTDMR